MKIKTLHRIIELVSLDNKDMVRRSLKTCEEAGELAGAVLSFTRQDYKEKSLDDILEEAVDVTMCGISVALEAGFSLEDIDIGMNKKLDKWESILKDE